MNQSLSDKPRHKPEQQKGGVRAEKFHPLFGGEKQGHGPNPFQYRQTVPDDKTLDLINPTPGLSAHYHGTGLRLIDDIGAQKIKNLSRSANRIHKASDPYQHPQHQQHAAKEDSPNRS